jgi:hypothetical protein
MVKFSTAKLPLTVALCLAILGFTLFSFIVAVAPVSAQSQTPNEARYDVQLNFIDFREFDHSANISIYLNAYFPNRVAGPTGVFGLDVSNFCGSLGSAHKDVNGTCLNAACTAGSWTYNFFARFYGSGAIDFFPYDAWMFNITLDSPVLSIADNMNTQAYVSGYGLNSWVITSWSHSGVNVREGWGTITLQVVLGRASWATEPIRYVPLVLFLILGLSTVIPHEDLGSKATICSAVIIFIAASMFSLGSNLPPRLYGLSFVEATYLYLLLVSVVFLLEFIFENRIGAGIANLSKRYNEHGSTIHARENLKILTIIVCLAMQLIVVGISIYWIASYTGSFQNLAAKNYPWSMLNRAETQFLPFAAVSVGFILNLGMTVIARIWRWRKEKEPVF